ncbi:MAG: RnfABCDGE type electron transport complex subunit D [Clostridia bacterium]|nr:RnfABCDGE type electron transport complex subunit D [Clostridia bacterium]
MSKLHISSTPHIHQKGSSTRNIMLDVVIAMIPATVAGIIIFGLKALLVVLTCVASAVATEYLFNVIAKKKQTAGDFSAVVTGLLLGLNLSTNVELWQCVVGSVFAILVVKCLFGGIGKNIANPAITARVFMLLTFGSVGAVVTAAPLFDLGFLGDAVPAADVVSGATPLVALNKGVAEAASGAPSVLQLLVGVHGGAIGETCGIALLIGFAYLVARKVIKWYVPASYVATVFVCYLAFGGFDVTYALQHVLAGGLLLGAIFMATDYVTTPTTNLGRIVFCVGAGLLTFAIRQFGSFPEGVSIAILTMNLLTPFISSWTRKKTLGGVK